MDTVYLPQGWVSLQGDSLLLTTNSPGAPDFQLTILRRKAKQF